MVLLKQASFLNYFAPVIKNHGVFMILLSYIIQHLQGCVSHSLTGVYLLLLISFLSVWFLTSHFLCHAHALTRQPARGKVCLFHLMQCWPSQISQSDHRYLHIMAKMEKSQLCNYCLNFFFQNQHNWMKPNRLYINKKKKTLIPKRRIFLF